MKLEMKVPSPGESITEVEIAQWLVSDGDFVEKDQAIAEVDSDKASLLISNSISLKVNFSAPLKTGTIKPLGPETATLISQKSYLI